MVLKILLVLLAIIAIPWIILFFSCIFVSMEKEQTHINKYYVLLYNIAIYITMFFGNVELKITGEDLLPKENFLLVSNHLSNFDPILQQILLIKRPHIVVSKPENFKIFLLGQVMHKMMFLSIDRENPRKAIVTINRAAEVIKNKEADVIIYPEGTRNKTPENGLLPFHHGVFKIAQKAKAPVVICKVSFDDLVGHNWPKRTHASLDILKVIYPDEYEAMTSTDIGNIAIKAISNSK